MTTKTQVKAALRQFCKFKTGFLGGLLFFAFALPPSLRADPAPSAAQILEKARLTEGSQHHVLRAQLRTGPTVIPFRLVLNGPEIRYEFSNPKQILVLKLGQEGARLEEITKEGAERVAFSRFDDRVRNSDITYEDLTLQFLYWKNATIKEQSGSTYVLDLHPGGVPSQYGTVRAWIRNGALEKAECYTRKGLPLAKFKVTGVTAPLSDGTRFFSSMRIERMVDGKSKDESPSYLEIKGEE